MLRTKGLAVATPRKSANKTNRIILKLQKYYLIGLEDSATNFVVLARKVELLR